MNEIKDSLNNNEKTLSKWEKLKVLLDNKKTLESSLKYIKNKTLDQFLPNICEIFKYKIALYLFNRETNKILLEKEYDPYSYKNLEISDDSKELCYDSCLIDFLFHFRQNNSELIKIIELLPEEENYDFPFFLCHLFYNDFINEKSAQDELFIIIYLLLEKEINEMSYPMEDTFLNKSFLDYFFQAFLHKEEIKKYINKILISEIEQINGKCFGYNSMDIIRSSKAHFKEFMNYKNNYTFFNMEKQYFYVNETFHSTKLVNFSPYSDSFIVIKKNKEDNINNDEEILITPRIINYENITINSILLQEFFNEINHNDIKKLLFQEKDDFMRSFYIKQLQSNKNALFPFNCRDYYFEKMLKEKLISRISIENYNKGYILIVQFINKILKKLENKMIIPFSIKIICKFIYILFKQKFPKITEFQLYFFIGRFLFDKLIIPIFEHIDFDSIKEKEIISFDTRKILVDIHIVFKQLIKGELFTKNQYDNYKIFNQFILDNYHRIKTIIRNFIDIKIPNKILSLIEKYHRKDFHLNPEENVRNIAEKKLIDLTSQKCICFNVNHLLLLYNIVNNNQKEFIKEGTEFEKIFNELSKYIPQMEINNNKYYIITKEEFQIEIKTSFKKQNNHKSEKEKDLLNKLKSHIISLLGEIKIRNNWNFFNKLDTKQIFEYINRYLLEIEKKKRLIPLNWYTKYILQNMELIDEKLKKDDYRLLYKIIEIDIIKLITKLKNLNLFFSVNINKKFLFVEKKKNYLKRQYQKIEQNILKLKTTLFIEKAKIDLCFMDGKTYNEFQKIINKNQESNVSLDTLIINEINNCVHTKLKDEKNNYLLSIEELNKYHLHTIKKFAYKLSFYNKLISEEIMHYVINQRAENKNYIISSNKEELNNIISFILSLKEISNTFMNYIKTIMPQSQILKPFEKKEEKQQISNYVLNYILKCLSINIYEEKPLLIDNNFYQKCCILSSFVQPSHFKLPNEFGDKDILKDIIFYFRKIEEQRIPMDIFEEFEKAFNLISSLFKFFFDKSKIGSEEMLNMISYCIILTKPKRMIFNTYFCKFFLMNDCISSNFGFNISQIENAINLINKINAQFLNLSDDEFNDKCSKFKFIK